MKQIDYAHVAQKIASGTTEAEREEARILWKAYYRWSGSVESTGRRLALLHDALVAAQRQEAG